MEIIAHIDIHVKMEVEKEDAFSLRYGKKWEAKKKAAKETADKMEAIGEKIRAIRMRNCAEIVNGRVCEHCGQMHIQYANLCRDRFCPVCKWRLSMKRFTSMYKIVTGLRQRYPEAAWQFVTLTCQNCAPRDLPEVMDEMQRCWNSIASAKKLKKKVAGWARATEITYNEVTGLLHPHFHVLVMYKELEEPDEYIIQRWLKGLKYKTTILAQDAQTIEFAIDNQLQIGWQVDQDENDDRMIEAVLETYKYSTKDKDVENMPLGVFRMMVDVLQNRRLVAFGGVIKEYAKEMELDRMEDADERDNEEEDKEVERCVKCGNSHLVEIIGKWAGIPTYGGASDQNQLYCDVERGMVFRDDSSYCGRIPGNRGTIRDILDRINTQNIQENVPCRGLRCPHRGTFDRLPGRRNYNFRRKGSRAQEALTRINSGADFWVRSTAQPVPP